MLRFIFRGVAAPMAAGMAVGTAVTRLSGLSAEPLAEALGSTANSPQMIASSFAAIAAAGATGYLLNRPKKVTEPSSPKL